MREIATPSSYIKGYILFEKGYVTIRSGGFVEVKSERDPNERPYIVRFFDDTPLNYDHGCGATAENPSFLCKHVIASQFSKFPNLIVPPHKEVVDAFKHYQADGIPSNIFDKDARQYGVEVEISDPELAEYLWACLLARLMSKRILRLDKNAVKKSYKNLLLSGKYLTAKLKSSISSGDKESLVYRVLGKCGNKSVNDIMNDIVIEDEKKIKNAKIIMQIAFKEDLLLPKKLGEAYSRIYQQYSDLNLVL